jgi:hypothetical protein
MRHGAWRNDCGFRIADFGVKRKRYAESKLATDPPSPKAMARQAHADPPSLQAMARQANTDSVSAETRRATAQGKRRKAKEKGGLANS